MSLIDSEWLLYHAGTGQTHRLNDVIGELFGHFWYSTDPIDVEGLQLAMSYLLETHEIKKIVESLLALHLIERAI